MNVAMILDENSGPVGVKDILWPGVKCASHFELKMRKALVNTLIVESLATANALYKEFKLWKLKIAIWETTAKNGPINAQLDSPG